MEEYLTTREVARYLRLNEKKIYDLVSKGKLPAARISGKWLFPRKLVDEWLMGHTIYPAQGLMGAMLEQMVIMQGSDDWLLSQVLERYLADGDLSVVSANVGSMAGLSAVAAGRAHAAGCHVGNDQVRHVACRDSDCYLINLFDRLQGLIYDRDRHPDVTGLESVLQGKLRFADRQPLSGTHRLTARLFEEAGLSMDGLEHVGPFSKHLSLALAIRTGQADAGVGIRVAADQCGLGFIPLHTEPYKLAIPPAFFNSKKMARFLDFVLSRLKREARGGIGGYGFEKLGVIETVQAPAGA